MGSNNGAAWDLLTFVTKASWAGQNATCVTRGRGRLLWKVRKGAAQSRKRNARGVVRADHAGEGDGGVLASVLKQLQCTALCAAALFTQAATAQEAQSLEEAWWTGPLLAASAATLPPGHALIEPYLFDVISNARFDADGKRHASASDHELGSLTYMLYGVSDRFTAGLIPRFFYDVPASGPQSSGVGAGDLQLQAQYGLTRYQPGREVPALALVINETLPTGRYDQLARASDGFGAGAYTTAISLYSQDYFWMPNGRILRARLDLTYSLSSSVSVRDQSVYGTPYGFSGTAYPGDGWTVDAAAEYSLTRSWVLALDVIYQYNANTRVRGTAGGEDYQADSGSSYYVGFAPAIEYNWSARAGVILGVRVINIGRNTSASLTPAIAVNLVF